ncbi:hypothetical protein D9758_018355 [Tetrapyrgos nigripes]|uniref:C2 domain-containing protein n=1 Tax=Tetrapyrgos nigripes TaxID=182062 RepID=A0A8H5BI23_9AGAR|nr:hypothetical protein D9758_018355 [Tetrapyrgos nigripes]
MALQASSDNWIRRITSLCVLDGHQQHFSMSSLIERISGAKHSAHDLAKVTKAFAEEKLIDVKYVDLEIQFIGASNIPKMDAFGLSDPYFVASLHSHVLSDTSSLSTSSSNSNYTLKDKSTSRISFVSSVQPHTLTPVWNELWRVLNVPSTSDLQVEVLDKDLGSPRDDYIGKFKVSLTPGAKEAEIERSGLNLGALVGRKDGGTFWLKINSKPSVMPPDRMWLQFTDVVLFVSTQMPLRPLTVSILNLNVLDTLLNVPYCAIHISILLPAFHPNVSLESTSAPQLTTNVNSNIDCNSYNISIHSTHPTSYSIHFSPTIGLLTNLPDARLYCTWKMYLVGVGVWFRERVDETAGDSEKPLPPVPGQPQQEQQPPPLPPRPNQVQQQVQVQFKPLIQHWNTQYRAAQSIFGSGPTSFAVRQGIMAGHRMLYARSTRNGFGVLGGGGGNGNGNGGTGSTTNANPDPHHHGGGDVDVDVGRPTPDEVRRIEEDLKRLLRGSVNVNPNMPNRGEAEASDSPNNTNTNTDAAASGSTSSASRTRTSTTANSGGNTTSKSPTRIKPTIYTYIISAEDDSFRFSETGAAFFVDFASKHALHANCAEGVRYSGEFHPRPRILRPDPSNPGQQVSLGWSAFDESIPDDSVEWELVFDNNSGTYAPDKKLLGRLKGLMEGNFCGGEVVPGDERKYDRGYEELTREGTDKDKTDTKSPSGLHIVVYDREDPRLKASVDATKEYALKFRGVRKEEFEPSVGEGEVTLSAKASTRRPGMGGTQKQTQKTDPKEKMKEHLKRLDSSPDGMERIGEFGVEGYADEDEGEGETNEANTTREGSGSKSEETKGLKDKLDRVEERIKKMGIGK